MRAYRFDEFDQLEGLRLHEEDRPTPQRGELLLRVSAVSLNYRDVAIPLGRYPRPAETGLVPCSDAAAEVVETGEGVGDFSVGDRVISLFQPRWFGGPLPATATADTYGSGQDGWLTEYKAVPREAVVRLPDSLSDEQGATLPCAGAPAWNALNGSAPLVPGQTVLTQGSGGVSVFAVQLAAAVGARVIATTSTDAKAEVLRALGADEVILYTETAEWGTAARTLTGGRGVDRVVEVGGPATIGQSLRAVAVGGEVVLIGFLSEDNPGLDYFLLRNSGATTRSITVGDRPNLEELVRVVAATGVQPVIDSVFEFEDARDAFARLRDGHHVGNIVVRVRGQA